MNESEMTEREELVRSEIAAIDHELTLVYRKMMQLIEKVRKLREEVGSDK